MKRIILTVFLATLITASSSAQSFSIGVVGGPSAVSALRTTINQNSVSPALGYSLALGLQFKLNRFFYLRVEPGIERKGFNISDASVPDSIGSMDEKALIDYYSIPVMLRFQAGKKWKIMIDLGAYTSYLDKAEKNNNDATAQFKQLDLGGAAAIGIGYTFAKRLTVSAHFKQSYGLIDVNKSASYNYNSVRTLASNYMIGLAYGFK